MERGKKIYLLPFDFVDEQSLLNDICASVENAFHIPCVQMSSQPIPRYAFSEARGQYYSTAILRFLENRLPSDALRLLGILDVDLFVPQLNFVFGEAAVNGRVCVISLTRLQPEYYGKQPDQQLFLERAVKEAIHELGHTFGLKHCFNSKCVMFFSNSIEDTDRKSAGFCGQCEHKLSKALQLAKHVA